MERFVRAATAAGLLLAAPALSGAAEIAILRNGRSLELAGYRLDGDRLVLRMSGGGELALPVVEVVEIRRQPDALPANGPVPRDSMAAATTTPAPGATHAAIPLEAAAGDVAGMAGGAPAADTATAIAGPEGGDGSGAGVANAAGEPPLLPVGGVFDRGALETMAATIARRHGVDATLVNAVITVESRYDPFAVSPRGAMGLMQLMPKTAARFEVENAFDPVQNVDGGVRYLKELLERYSGQVRLALAAYNAGEEAVERHSGIPPYRETIDYVRKVQRLARR